MANFLPCLLSQVAGAYSKTWSYREDALLAVYKKLLELPPAIPREELRNLIRAAVFLVKKALLDKVSSVSQILNKQKSYVGEDALNVMKLKLIKQLLPVKQYKGGMDIFTLSLSKSSINHVLWIHFTNRTKVHVVKS